MGNQKIRKVRRQEQVRVEILDAARNVLLSRGLSGLTMAAVARELQLTKAALYYYFSSKDALVFELIYLGLAGHAEVVGNAVADTTTGANAIEALIRASSEHYGNHLDELRLAYLVPQIGSASTMQFDSETIERIRPFNDQMYGAVAKKIHQDQQVGRIAQSIDGQRLAFLAHTSVLGMLTVEGLVEVADDTPLIHTHEAMVDELVHTFIARLAVKKTAT